MIELLVVIAIVAILASLLLPALATARASSRSSACRSNLRQWGVAWELYLGEHEDRFPDRRDLKLSLPGGYKPWPGWPRSDPRAGWVFRVLTGELSAPGAWVCPSAATRRALEVVQVRQAAESNGWVAGYWLWRFDRADDPVATDNFWGKRREQAVADLQSTNHPVIGIPAGMADVEWVVDVYFPASVPDIEEPLRGLGAHAKGKNRLWLDGHVSWSRDPRLR